MSRRYAVVMPHQNTQFAVPATLDALGRDGVVRWDGERLYVEHDIYHNGQLVHRKYRKNVTEPVAKALQALINRAQQ